MDLGEAAITLFAIVAMLYAGVFAFEMKTRGIDDLRISEHPIAIGTLLITMGICSAALILSSDWTLFYGQD